MNFRKSCLAVMFFAAVIGLGSAFADCYAIGDIRRGPAIPGCKTAQPAKAALHPALSDSLAFFPQTYRLNIPLIFAKYCSPSMPASIAAHDFASSPTR